MRGSCWYALLCCIELAGKDCLTGKDCFSDRDCSMSEDEDDD